ncbi:MAG TPA: hypothetical protein VG222_00710 [Vicinamibacterales bacterium]|jgi:hypothetical protein|nr:hypothetical protein [Vicinamibacterales bacterium]
MAATPSCDRTTGASGNGTARPPQAAHISAATNAIGQLIVRPPVRARVIEQRKLIETFMARDLDPKSRQPSRRPGGATIGRKSRVALAGCVHVASGVCGYEQIAETVAIVAAPQAIVLAHRLIAQTV